MARRRTWQRFVEPLAVLPFGFVGIRLYEWGFDWVSAILLVLLAFIYLPVLIVLWSGR